MEFYTYMRLKKREINSIRPKLLLNFKTNNYLRDVNSVFLLIRNL